MTCATKKINNKKTLKYREQAEPQNYTLKTTVKITQSLSRNTAKIWQIKENAPNFKSDFDP